MYIIHKVISFCTYVQNITTENESRINKIVPAMSIRRKDGISCWQHVVRMPAMTTTMTSMDAGEKCSQIKRPSHTAKRKTCITYEYIRLRARCAQSVVGAKNHVLIVVQKIYE